MENKSVKMSVFSHKIGRKALSLLLSIAMILSVMMTMIPAMEVKAADDYTSLKNTTTVIHFDNKEWYLIDYDDSTVTLLSKECVAASKFNNDTTDGNNYSGSVVESAVSTYYNNSISTEAKTAVSGSGAFLLTTEQAQKIKNANSEVLKCSQATGAEANIWWLCSPGDDDRIAACVGGGEY